MQTKFNVGDKVKVLDGSEIEDYVGCWVHDMAIAVGEIRTIDVICITNKGIGYLTEEDPYAFDERGLELVAEKRYSGKIIFTKGDDVFKTGHIYEIKDGYIADPRGHELLPHETQNPLKDLTDVKDYFTAQKDRKRQKGWGNETLEFIEVKDD